MAEAPLPAIRSLPSWLLGRAAARGRALVADALAAEGMKMWHHVVLSAVRDLAPVAQADLGRSVQLDPKDLVGVLNDLQAAGLVVREPDPADRRKNAVSLADLMDRIVALTWNPRKGPEVLSTAEELAAAFRSAGATVVLVRVERPGL